MPPRLEPTEADAIATVRSSVLEESLTPAGGHFPWYDDPDQCAALVAEGL